MKTPFFWPSLGFALGIATDRWVRAPAASMFATAGFGIALLWFLRGKRIFLPLFVLVMVLLGNLAGGLSSRVPSTAIQHFAGKEKKSLVGTVISLPEMKLRGKRNILSLVLRAKSIHYLEKGKRRQQKVTGQVQVFLIQSPFLPQVGDELRLWGTLEVPRRARNPGEFDYGRFLAEKGIYVIFQTIGYKSVNRLREGVWYLPGRLLAQTRRFLAGCLDRLYIPSEAAMMKALVLGLRGEVLSELRDQFMKTGTIHLLAISGLNITMIAGSLYFLFLFCGMAYRLTTWVTLGIVGIYIGLAGFGLPVQRAGYVAMVMLCGVLWGRPGNLLNAMWAAFFLILAWNPQSLWNIGFQLSFLSVFSLIVILPFLNRLNVWSLSLGSSFAILIGTFPVVLYYFNTFSPVSILANLAAIPLLDAALLTALFSIVFSGVPFLSLFWPKVASLFLNLGLAWVRFWAGCPHGYSFFVRPSEWKMAGYYGLLALILMMCRRQFRWKRSVMIVFAICWGSLALSFFRSPQSGVFELTVLASGKNQIAHVTFSNQLHWLVNTGRSFPSDQGEWLVSPFLKWRGIQRLEGIWLMDFTKKHSGGLPAVLRSFPVRYCLSPFGFPGFFEKVSGGVRCETAQVQSGDRVLMGQEGMEVLAANRFGMALRVTSGPWKFLLISRMDGDLFEKLLKKRDLSEHHAVILLPGRERPPSKFYEWIEMQPPLLIVSPGDSPLGEATAGRGWNIPHLDLNRTGALSFRRNGRRLEIESFLCGKMGGYSFL